MQMQTREQGVWWVGSAAFGATAAHDTAKRARSRDDGMRVFADTYQRRYDPPFAAGSAPPTPFLRAAAFPMIRVGRIKAHETGFAALPPRGRPWSGGGGRSACRPGRRGPDVADAPAFVERGGHRTADVVGGLAHIETAAQHHLDGQDLRERTRGTPPRELAIGICA